MKHEDFFFRVLDLLEENNIQYFLFCGTLLGAVRDKKFLPKDTSDTDIAISDEDTWKLRRILNKEHLAEKWMKYEYIRRKELTVVDLKRRYKVDIFLMQKEEDKYYVYSYRKGQVTGRWDKEWRVIFPYELFFPLKTIKFLGRKVTIPNKYKEILQIHYGESWETPNPDYDSSQPENRDHSYVGFEPAGFNPKDIIFDEKEYEFAYIMVNVLRPEETKNCVSSLQVLYPNCKIYVADQDVPNKEMYEFYEKYNIEYYFVPYDCGLSYCRNFLIEKVKESYIMWGDNDFIFDERSNIDKAIKLLKAKDNIGIVGGCVLKDGKELHYERILMYDKKYGILVYIPLELTNPQPLVFDGLEYYNCDLTFNYAIVKKEVFDNKKIRWNEGVKVRYEHSDAFLKFKQFSKYDVVYFPTMKVNHVHNVKRDEYWNLRNRRNDGVNFSEFWNLRMNFTIGQGKEIYGESVISEKILKNEIKPGFVEEPIIEPKKIEKTIEPEIPIEKKVNSYISPTDLLKTLTNNNISFCLVKNSCLDTVRTHTLKSTNLYISLKSWEEYNNMNKILEKEYKCFPDNLKVEVQERHTKQMRLYEYTIDIPFPTVRYLEKTFGKNWVNYET